MLTQLRCVPCRAGTKPMSKDEVQPLLGEIPEWTLKDKSIERQFEFEDFEDALAFVNRVAELAQEEDHHPDIHIYYNKVRIELSTHKIGGLSKNDLIMAAKIDGVSAFTT